MNSGKKDYITGLKGLACITIMRGHYFINPHTATENIKIIEAIRDTEVGYLARPGNWLVLFFVISGYLISKTKITSIPELIKKSFLRFMRFAVPAFFVYMGIFALYKIFGFHNTETAAIFTSMDFQQNYYFEQSYSFWEFFTGPVRLLILNDCDLNGPYWVMRAMLLCSIYIYGCTYIKKYIHNDAIFILCQTVLIVFLMFTDRVVYLGCLVGMLLGMYEDRLNEITGEWYFALIVLAAAVFRKSLTHYLCDAVFSALIIIYVPKLRIAERFLSSRPIKYIGELSWGIYSFHWPVLCSVGALVMLRTYTEGNLSHAYWLGFAAASFVTFALSIIYYYTFDRWTGKFIGFLKKKLMGAKPQAAGADMSTAN